MRIAALTAAAKVTPQMAQMTPVWSPNGPAAMATAEQIAMAVACELTRIVIFFRIGKMVPNRRNIWGAFNRVVASAAPARLE
ncbi:hypothetical protein FHR90_000827 [Endobacter medicaginis]|uniref:Uncharacterized protein n=1 Tax=Endobacter medicaginis TaxID=1181271 RepID=A0A839V0D4_9PROT|nr:hypothetical protein [Endobacter medicaginis]MBB3173009.1 hypothetical protein [Endobacter medicaginis]MCX5475212.1 hypothetical protein [Endobacter medicaginis]